MRKKILWSCLSIILIWPIMGSSLDYDRILTLRTVDVVKAGNQSVWCTGVITRLDADIEHEFSISDFPFSSQAGQTVDYYKVEGVNGLNMLPVRFLDKALGLKVDCRDGYNQVIIQDGREIIITGSSNVVLIDQPAFLMEEAPVFKKGVFYMHWILYPIYWVANGSMRLAIVYCKLFISEESDYNANQKIADCADTFVYCFPTSCW